jgi:hypothetical protein
LRRGFQFQRVRVLFDRFWWTDTNTNKKMRLMTATNPKWRGKKNCANRTRLTVVPRMQVSLSIVSRSLQWSGLKGKKKKDK